MIKKMLSKLLPLGVRGILSNCRLLSLEFGQYRTIQRHECVDKDGQAIPWFTYPAIEYIKQLSFKDKTVFEYGSGYSTVFWAGRCRKLVSVEDDPEWHHRIGEWLPDSVEYILAKTKEEYVNAIGKYPAGFDVIVIDGKYRHECAAKARLCLRSDGFIIVDNAERYGKISQFLRDSDLIEVDMSGFIPMCGHTTTTSFYFSRNVRLSPAHERQPVHGIGNLHEAEDDESG